MSFGAKLYSSALEHWLPSVAPDLHFDFIVRGDSRFIEQVGVPLRAATRGSSLIHFTGIPSYLTTRPFIVTVHDLHYFRLPDLLPPKSRYLWQTYMRHVLPRASLVIVDDENTVGDCVRFANVKASRCRVIPLGYDPAMLDVEPYRGERPYIMYAGNRTAHKRVGDLITAWEALPKDLTVDLYLSDSAGKNATVSSVGSGRRSLVELGHVAQSQMWSFLKGAAAYVQPSIAEGFGLPMLEAAALGVPLIATRECVPGILQSHAALYHAGDVAALTRTLLNVLKDETDRSRAIVAKQIAREFTWQRCASATADVYREACGAG